MRSRSFLSFLTAGLGIVLALGFLHSCGGGGGGGGSDGGGGAVQTNTSAINVPIDSGGSIEFPPGSLPENATVSVKATRTPVLPDDAQAHGTAIAIQCNAALQRPAWLRLPIPAGVADPSTLAIFRVEADGTLTEHLTSVEGSELVTATPGFSTFTTAERIAGGELFAILLGPSQLMPGETAQYRIELPSRPPDYPTDYTPRWVGAEWTYSGPLHIGENEGVTAIFQAAPTVAEWTDASIAVSFVNPVNGRRYFGARTVRVDPVVRFGASLTTLRPTIYAGEEFAEFSAHTVGMAPPIAWSWNFGYGDTGGPVPTNDTTFSLPRKDFPLSGRYRVSVTAQSGTLTANAETYVTVINPPLLASVSGPQRLQWSDPQISAQYVADASGGKSPYLYSWSLAPGGFESADGLSSQTIPFDQPGEHRLKVTVSDFADASADSSTTIPVTVEGGETLHTHMLDLPASAEAGTPVAVSVQVRGGVLVVAGKKAGYEFHFDWGDGTTVVEKDVLLTGTPYQGIAIPMSHTYTAPGTYPVTARVYDATGNVSEDVREIVIGAPSTVWIVGTWNSSGYAEFSDSTGSSSGTFTFNSDETYVHDFDLYNSIFGNLGHQTITGSWSLDGGVLTAHTGIDSCSGSAPDNATEIVLSCYDNLWTYTLTR